MDAEVDPVVALGWEFDALRRAEFAADDRHDFEKAAYFADRKFAVRAEEEIIASTADAVRKLINTAYEARVAGAGSLEDELLRIARTITRSGPRPRHVRKLRDLLALAAAVDAEEALPGMLCGHAVLPRLQVALDWFARPRGI
jgi:hypothetical protein